MLTEGEAETASDGLVNVAFCIMLPLAGPVVAEGFTRSV